MKILLTGGLGYIGSHVAAELAAQGHEIAIIDNLANSKISVLTSLNELTGKHIEFFRSDVEDETALRHIFSAVDIDAVIHLAGLKSVAESVSQPLSYFTSNVCGALTLLRVMEEAGVRRIVFSSSASIYGEPQSLPIDEEHPASPQSPYAESKHQVERVIEWQCSSQALWSAVILRYFNPVGAHPSLKLGEDPSGVPSNLVPYMARVATGIYPQLQVYGDNYPTKDGTGVRDYLDITDLARGHACAVDYLISSANGCETFNLGTGNGVTVFELIEAFSAASGRPVPIQVVGRRDGDVASCYAGVAKAEEYLGWKATRSIEEMCQTSWLFNKKSSVNPS